MVFLTKIFLAAILLFCLFDMPYSYYQFVRFASFFGFSLLASKCYVQRDFVAVTFYFGLALLFQPFIKVVLGREVWNIIDVIVGVGLLVYEIEKKPAKEIKKIDTPKKVSIDDATIEDFQEHLRSSFPDVTFDFDKEPLLTTRERLAKIPKLTKATLWYQMKKKENQQRKEK